jgi:hypothetical protein
MGMRAKEMSDNKNTFGVFKKLPGPRAKHLIVYSMAREGAGWRLSAYVPPSVPPNDRVAVVRWLGDYQQQVKKVQPEWLVRFRSNDPCHYELNMMPLNVPASSGAAPHSTQLETLDHLWHQLSLDYA